MLKNRIANLSTQPTRSQATVIVGVVIITPPGFAVCPPTVAQAAAWQQELYRRAYEQARAAAEIPRHYRMLFSVWN